MLMSIALMLLSGMWMSWICKKVHLPGLLGMLLTGIVLGPCVWNLIDDSILNISPDLRKIALIIILTRAGLSLRLEDLKTIGRPAILMCFVPACFEMLGMILLAPRFLDVSVLEAAIMGAVVGAVSPAVIVPKMLKLMEENCGTKKGVPQLILAGASVDDVFVIVLFTVFTGAAQGAVVSVKSFADIPVSIILGVVIGTGVGYLLAILFKKSTHQGYFQGDDFIVCRIYLSDCRRGVFRSYPVCVSDCGHGSGNCTSEKTRGSCGTIVGKV